MNEITNLSPVNQTYITKKQQTPEEAKTVTSPIQNKKVLMVGAACLGAVALGGLIAAGKYKQAQKLAEHIDFTPAKTLEEAKEFAAKNLKIKHFDLTDLDSANYVNEALTNYNNNISVDHRKIIRNVRPLTKEDSEIGAAAIDTLGNMMFDENCDSDAIKFIDEFFKKCNYKIPDYGFTNEQRTFLQRALNPESLANMNKKELLYCEDLIASIDGRFNTQGASGVNGSAFDNLSRNKKVIEYLKSKNLPTTLKEFLKLTKEEQTKIIQDISKNTKVKLQYQDRGAFGMINHEIGHKVHADNVGTKMFNALCYQDISSGADGIKKAYERFTQELGIDFIDAITGNVSLYATTGPAEFVAETYSYLCNGQKFSDEIMDLYKKYGGVIPACAK